MDISQAIAKANKKADNLGYGVLVVKNIGDASGNITLGDGTATQWQNHQKNAAIDWMLESWDGVVVAVSSWDGEKYTARIETIKE